MAARRTVIVGTRGSQLALWQTRHVIGILQQRFPEIAFQERVIKTSGDGSYHKSLQSMGGKGLFTREIDEAQLAGKIELAVHSMKDLPVDLPQGLTLAATPKRVAPHDGFFSAKYASLKDLPQGATVGTGSLRRQAQLRRARPDAQLKLLRGNIETRLRKLAEGEYDAIILAAAGAKRLGMCEHLRCVLPLRIMLPAAGQGALAIVSREEDQVLWHGLSDINTERCVRAERAMLAALGGGCHMPVGALGRIVKGRLSLDGLAAHPESGECIRRRIEGDPRDPEALGKSLGKELLSAGAKRILRNLNEGNL
ncbi:hydroxymethylbilane synthase [Candidatus Sumerlaeota bacterium]|nr:hydroxymethylbilane synthase [Candidatus Sumerlaeota bacterium]